MHAKGNEPKAHGIEQLAVNTIRTLAIDAIERANSGHPGMPMGAAPMAFVLWTRFLRHNPDDPRWPDRDRFVLSAGHGSMLLYSLLHLSGYDLTLEDLKQFRQWGSRTPGHPEYGATPGVEMTTGPLGQGLATAVGMAMAERFLAARFNRPGHEVVDHYTYVLCGDGDLMEGVSAEAASLAGHLKLGKLIVLYDSNDISLDGETSLAFTEDVRGRFAAYGWQVLRVADGNDLVQVAQAIARAREEDGRPSLIEVKTTIGYGSPGKAGSAKAHGSPLGTQEVTGAKQAYGWPEDAEFWVPGEVREYFARVKEKGAEAQRRWLERMDEYRRAYPELARVLEKVLAGDLPEGWDRDLPVFRPEEGPLATRQASGKAIQALARRIPTFLGGSADLASSNETAIEGEGAFQPDRYDGRNLWFGVREHAMGAALNGMALHGGLRVYGGTFLVFSDYMRPAIRLAALMEQPVVYVFTHDSIAVGEDGPTHQPIEQIPALRLIPGLRVYRPADANETVAAWRDVLARPEGPAALVLTRQKLPVLAETARLASEGVARGGYVLADAENPKAIIIATGSEVSLAMDAKKRLAADGIPVRVVSMPCRELFDRQPAGYKDTILPPAIKARVAVEMAHPMGWDRYVGDRGRVIGIDHFGASAPGGRVQQEFGFTVDRVCQVVREVVEG
ncbi:transketolase [Kyrpidia tusciae]|uniref:Transketolase n=1 Tax=Kyrpidia tusciae (strain DSM 2912 / NBRC 15312 / T2) TaxID=562970 RepID=D5WU51_KYRT2|nr:transketolase [Kyrpidia tusciae]ADG07303.1 transketolase [Kyrpidia tusciae DSM 2912]